MEWDSRATKAAQCVLPRPELERAVEEPERASQEAIVRSKKQCFAIAFYGMIKAGNPMFLNALVGRMILPPDSESDDSCTPYSILSITADLSSTVWPCRLRHVEGQAVPELQFQAEPFLVALRKLQAYQYEPGDADLPTSGEEYVQSTNL